MIGLVRGFSTLMLLLLFLAIVAWAYSGRRRQEFESMARIALESDESDESDQTEARARPASIEDTARE